MSEERSTADQVHAEFRLAQARAETERVRYVAEKAVAEQETARIRRAVSESRMTWLGWFFVGLGVFLLLFAIIASVAYSAHEDRLLWDRQQRACTAAGAIWYDHQCLSARKAQ